LVQCLGKRPTNTKNPTPYHIRTIEHRFGGERGSSNFEGGKAMTNKQTRTKRIQVRCQPCHYEQILKVANDERDRLESIDAEIVEIVKPAIIIEQTEKDMFQIGNKGILRYFAFFNKMQDLLSDKNLPNVVTESEMVRKIMVKQIEKLIIERGV